MERWCSVTFPYVHPKNESPDAQTEQQSVHMPKIKEYRLFVSAAARIETAAPSSCCYTLWCSAEMWAALLIELLLASSLMSHCSFHDPLLKEVGVWCNPTGFVFRDLNLAGSVIYDWKPKKPPLQMYFISLNGTNKPGFTISFLIDELLPCIQHNSTRLSHLPEVMDVLLNLT